MGDKDFHRTLQQYYDAYWFRIAGPEDFKKIAQRRVTEKAHEIDALYKRWMLEQHGDEDIGTGTMDSLLKTLLSTDRNIPPEKLDEFLKELESVLKQQ